MKYTVYVLKSQKDNKKYIGVTSDFERRLQEHNRGSVKSTRTRKPMELIYKETYKDKSEAWKRENFFKSGQGRVFLKNIDMDNTGA